MFRILRIIGIKISLFLHFIEKIKQVYRILLQHSVATFVF